MRHYRIFSILFLLLSVLALAGFSSYQNAQLEAKQLRDVLVQLGYEVKDLVTDPGKEKYTATFNKDGLDIPVGYEISPSKNYIWLTVNLGGAPTESSPKCFALLKQNAKIQPTFFYVTESGRLMAAQALLNRNVTNADLRKASEVITSDIGKTKDVWQK
jgi:hypothetical protein